MTTAGSIRFCRSAAEAPSLPGAYVLQIEIPRPTQVRIGRRPPVTLAAGRYLYCGSAWGPCGLKARVARHMRRGKAIRWHAVVVRPKASAMEITNTALDRRKRSSFGSSSNR